MFEINLQIRNRLKTHGGVHFCKTFLEYRHLRRDREGSPRNRSEGNVVKQVGILSFIERVIKVHVDVRLEVSPTYGRIVSPGLDSIANTQPPDRPTVERIDRRELWEINWPQLSRRFESIEL